MSDDMDNTFLLDLLDFQQDGNASEVGPHNWIQEPESFPIVRTKYLDSIMESAAVLNEQGEKGVWHFLVGAPGNGKSALVGALVRNLLKGGWDFIDKASSGPTLDYIATLTSGDGLKKNFAKLLIIQDASVSASPHDPNANLAQELLEVLENCYETGKSVIVCANRGVLEQLPELIAGLENGQNFNFFKKGIEGDHSSNVRLSAEAKRPVYQRLEAKFDHLDTETITRPTGSRATVPIQELLDGLLNEERWSTCASCSSKAICPFLGNRELLKLEPIQAKVLELLRAAETYRNQPIVFREALALFSTVLAGVPGDFETQSPCEWVREQHRDMNLIALMDRRIYQVLFSGDSVANLSASEGVRKHQLQDLQFLAKLSTTETKHIDALIKSWPSSISASPELRDCLSSLDPALASQDDDVADFASFDSDHLLSSLEEHKELWQLEILAILTWRALSASLQNESQEESGLEERLRGLRLLMRITGISLLRLCVLTSRDGARCWYRFEQELSEYIKIITLVQKAPSWTPEESRWLSEQQTLIDGHVKAAVGSRADYTKVMENLEVLLDGHTNLAPLSLCRKVHPPYLTLGLSFNDKSRSDADLSAQAYCWIRKTRRKLGAAMISESIPQELLGGIRVARRNAVSKSRYLEDKDIRLSTFDQGPDGRSMRKILRKDEWSGGAVIDEVTD